MNGNFLAHETRHGIMDIYVSCEPSTSPKPVVIVLMEAFGVNSHIRSVCDRLAKEGYFAAAPDLYYRESRRIEVPYDQRKDIMPLLGKMKNQDIISDVRETINFLEDLPNADTKSVSTIGFCVGGFASALCATKLQIKKMVSFYGGGMVNERKDFALMPILQDLSQIKSKCLFFFGGMDASIPSTDIKEIEKKLVTSKVPFEVDIFPLSDHGFFCDERKTYNQEDAAVAWKKTISFLNS